MSTVTAKRRARASLSVFEAPTSESPVFAPHAIGRRRHIPGTV